MEIASPRIVVVDDEREHGEAIARKLWQMGYASLFVEYGERVIDGKYGRFGGVRLIFMDLDLVGEGRIGFESRAYPAVAAVIEKILDDENGPWALVTWTGHADHADELWDFLQSHLPPHLRPLSRQVMDKEVLLGDEKDEDLEAKLRQILSHQDAVRCLLRWESGVLKSANEVIAELVKVAASLGGDSGKNLGALLYELAEAEAGKTIANNDDRSRPLYRVLTALLSDRLGSAVNGGEGACSGDYVKKAENVDINNDWKRRINTMLNLELAELKSTCPGAIFEIRDDLTLPHPLDRDRLEIIEKQFLYPEGAPNNEQEINNLQRCTLCLIDVSPPCDHSQEKLVWRRFVVAVRVPVDVLSKKRRDKLRKREYLKLSPEFIEDNNDPYLFIINANLHITLCDSNVREYLGDPVARLKEEIISDYLGWLGRHTTRLGHVSLPI